MQNASHLRRPSMLTRCLDADGCRRITTSRHAATDSPPAVPGRQKLKTRLVMALFIAVCLAESALPASCHAGAASAQGEASQPELQKSSRADLPPTGQTPI